MNEPRPSLPDIPNVKRIDVSDLPAAAETLKEQGARFMSATALDIGENFEIYYHFDHDLEMSHLLVVIPRGGSVPSLTPTYFCAFLAENEMRDLFGVQVDGLNIDYGGKLLVTDKFDHPPMLRHLPSEDDPIEEPSR